MTKQNLIVVTGGAGFVGSHLIEKLVDDGYYVISIDNYSNGTVDNHIDHQNVTYINGHSGDVEQLLQPYLTEHTKINWFFHLGEYSRVEQSFNDIESVWANNIEPIYNVVQFCKKQDSKLIYAGSSTKFASNTDPEYVMSPYAYSKARNTDFVNQYADWYGLNYAITYFYNVYGPREKATGSYATVIAKFNQMLIEGKTLTVTSPGTQKRNFTHIDDVIDALILIARHGKGDEFGIGSTKKYSIIDIVHLFDQEQFMMTPKVKGNRTNASLKIDNTLDLGWRPQHCIKEYIKQLNEQRKV